MSHNRLPLTSRPLDLIYFLFFLIHIPATLLIDVQVLYPAHLVPEPISRLPTWYLQSYADPVIAGAFGLNGPPALWVWFKSFLVLEAVFQLPVFAIGLYGLWKGSRTLYPLFLIYAASSTTSTIPCISAILSTPISSSPVSPSRLSPGIASGETGQLTITAEQRTLLLASYAPFLFIQTLMCVDMAVRVAGLITRGERAELRERAGKAE